MSEALKAAREIVDACAGENRPSPAWAAKVRDQIDAALTAGEQEPVKPEGYRFKRETEGFSTDGTERFSAPPTAQLEALRKELAFAKAALSSLSVENDLNKRMFHQASRAAETAEARVAELEKALEPFAEFGHERKHVWEEDFATARRVREGGKD